MATPAQLRKHPGHISLDWRSWKDLQRAIRNSADKDLPKRMGKANKKTGKLVIQKLQPQPTSRAVGRGRGAAVRPSASRREVLLRAGGSHRADRSGPDAPREQWGPNPDLSSLPNPPPRPDIRETVARHRDEIEQFWLQAISDAMDDTFADTSP